MKLSENLFSARETALGIWIVLFIIVISFLKSIRFSLIQLINSITDKKNLLLIIISIIYVVCGVIALYNGHFWISSDLKDCILWFFFSAMPTIFNSIDIKDRNKYFLDTLKDIFKFTVIIEFITDKYTFNIYIELLSVPLLFLVGYMSAFYKKEEKYFTISKVLNFLIIIYGFTALGNALIQLFEDYKDFFSVSTLKEISLPIILSIWLMPFLYVLYIYVNYETVFAIVGNQIKDAKILKYAKKKAILEFKLDIELLKRWQNRVSIKHVNSMDDIKFTFIEMNELKAKEKNQIEIPIDIGWSPNSAKTFLKSLNVKVNPYNNVYEDEWAASSNVIKLDDDVLSNVISYYVSGESNIVKNLKIVLHIYSKKREEEACKIFIEYVKCLYYSAKKQIYQNTSGLHL